MSTRGWENQVLHEQFEAMLPWHVNGTLGPGEREELSSHLQHCPSCRREVELQALIRDRMRRGEQVLPAPMASLDGLMKRIASYERSSLRLWKQRLAGWFRGRALERTLVAQAATILLLVGVLAWLAMRPGPPAEYHTLGASPQWQVVGREYIHLEPRELATAAQVKALLEQVGGRIVHGPSPGGAYIVELDFAQASARGTPEEVAAWLNEQPAVTLARLLDATERR